MIDFFVVYMFLSLFSIMGLIGFYILLRSPCIFRMNKERNTCTKESKFIWQKNYKIKTLCKLSEVKKAFNTGGILSPMNILYLKLRSGKDITLFLTPGSSNIYSAPSFNSEVNKINNFLKGNDKECILEHSLFMVGFIYVISFFFALLFLSFVIFY